MRNPSPESSVVQESGPGHVSLLGRGMASETRILLGFGFGIGLIRSFKHLGLIDDDEFHGQVAHLLKDGHRSSCAAGALFHKARP